MGYFVYAGDDETSYGSFLYLVIVRCVIRHYDVSFRNELQIHSAWKQIRTVVVVEA